MHRNASGLCAASVRSAVRAIFSVALLGLVVAGCQPESGSDAQEVSPPTVWVEKVGKARGSGLSYSGTIRARSDAPVAFRVGGKLSRRGVDIGDRVEAGDLVARLDATDFDAALHAEEAQERAARAEAKRTADALARIETLKAKGHVSQASLDAAQAAADAAAEALKAAGERRLLAENQRAYTVLRADVAGVVTAVLAEPGEVVALGQPVVRIAAARGREAEVAVPEAHVAAIAQAEAHVTLWALPGKTFSARLRELSPQADQAARTFTARFELEDPSGLARLGMTATVHLDPSGPARGVAVPLSAVWYRGEDAFVWRAAPGDSRVKAVAVEVLRIEAARAIVDGALEPGVTVVSMGVHRLDADLEVRVVERAPADPVLVGALQ
ncbi:efflux RND transporter periplasmic adaptor subunit [Stappia sp. ES.058]|uniref:efflux RND transporter periplasmic adaptor subunit n=1 Tax=Stappia sp. ES.058 TaxID=1881061 RepID=UPI00087BB987|nr:efflux RND transporter periplasmic adaptor subunit [Stappia sp. ES.058]SDU25466.1 RND family efflux transporter, MFP subunit [Stappia sp. ES.058]